MEYIKVSEAAKKWDISPRRVRLLCSQGKIEGAIQQGKLYMIPANAGKPADERIKENKIVQQSLHGSMFQRINDKQEQLRMIRPLTSGEVNRLKEDFLIEFIYNSCAISGINLTLEEVALILSGGTTEQKSLKDHLDALGLHHAYYYCERNINEKNIFSEESILAMHGLTLISSPFDKGVYRKIPIRRISTHGKASDPTAISKNIKDLLKLNDKRKRDLHLVERLALFHLDFEGIHPFVEGTGHVNRLLVNLQLLQEELPPIPFDTDNKKEYFDAFTTYFEKKDSNPMIVIMGKYIEKSLDFYLSIFKNS